VTVPVLWDKRTKRVLNNESSEIIRMLNSEFKGIGNDVDFYPLRLRSEIDRINDFIYANVNNGVYRCGFARSQEAYEAAYDQLFQALDEIEARLARQRYLLGGQITESDWRLFPTLVRFDVAYFSLFKCNRQRIADYPNLSNYMRELYQVPGVAGTVKVPLLRHKLLVDQASQSDRHYPKGNTGRLRTAARPRTLGVVTVAQSRG
jgi:putative glutathione S-transferase